MASLAYKIEAYLERTVNFKPIVGEIRLQNDGSGDYIKYWSDSVEKPQPTAEQLEAVSAQADILYHNFHTRKVRRRAYGRIGDQLDEIFKDIDAWKVRIQSIKDDNPKR